MRTIRLLLLILSMTVAVFAKADPISEMLQRILPENGDAQKFETVLTNDETECFTIACNGEKITVKGSNLISVAAGINWFLQHYAGIDISWNNPTAKLPEVLPNVAEERHESSVDYRYYLNFCTHSYSMSFWDWDRWQQEIDWMALHGINMPLAITGMESVWKEVLMQEYGYTTLDQVNEFVCGSAYYGWFFMNNLTGWGGPQPESWYEQRTALARKIFQRMKDLGMKPVIPGYVGMVPEKFLTYAATDKTNGWVASDIVNGGTWCSFTRPYFVNNTSRLKEFAQKYYAAFDRLFGDVCDTHFYAIDPFHEGGVPSGVTNAQSSVKAMYDALIAYDNSAIWVCQHWQDNPTTILTYTVPAKRLIILDLHGDSSGDTECSGHHTTSNGTPHDWIWGQVSNFGGNVGIFGRMDRLIECFYTARNNAKSNNLVGIGAIPEGIDNNAMLYDLLYALPWTNEDYTRQSWLEDYVKMRYGAEQTNASTQVLCSAWNRLGAGAYNCPNDRQQGTTESVFLMRPALKPGTVSSWANSNWYWDINEMRTALYEMLSVSEEFKDNNNYRYDLVDLMRQALSDYAKLTLDSLGNTSGTARRKYANRFLEMLLDQDRLLGTRIEFRLGRWIEMARSLGTTDEEKNLYEKNARMLLTTWGDKAQCETGGLHDYANREWNGLLSSYYYPRWKAYFNKNYVAQSWFAYYEWPFVTGTRSNNATYLPTDAPYAYGTFTKEAEGDEIEVVKELYNKYFADFKPEVWTVCMPRLDMIYMLTNVEKWYGDPDTEGLNLAAPNSDFNGYRLKRSALKQNDESFHWQFVASPTTDGAVRLENIFLRNQGATAGGSFLTAVPSTSGYPAFTFGDEGTDFNLYQSDDRYFLTTTSNDAFFSPDCAWKEACVLISKTRSATSLLHLNSVETGLVAVKDNKHENNVYDVAGKKTNRMMKGNVYIINGNKELK